MLGGDREFTVKQAMRQAMRQIEQGALKGQPEVQARLQLAIADVLFGNADLDEAIALAKLALTTQEGLHGADSVEITTALSTLGRAYEAKGLYAEAEAAHRRTLGIRRARVPGNELAITRTMVNLANAVDLQGKHAEAEALLREVIDTRTRLLGPDDPSLAGPINNLGVIYKVQERYADAEPLYRRALESRERTLGADHQKTADSVNNLANVLAHLERRPEAEALWHTFLCDNFSGFTVNPNEVMQGAWRNPETGMVEFDKMAVYYVWVDWNVSERMRTATVNKIGNAARHIYGEKAVSVLHDAHITPMIVG